MKTEKIKKYTSLYGGNPKNWPQEVLRECEEILRERSDSKKIVQEEQRFEAFLNERRFENPSALLATKILFFVKHHGMEIPKNWREFFGDLFSEFCLKPIYALGIALSIGFAMGIVISATLDQLILSYAYFQNFYYYGGVIL